MARFASLFSGSSGNCQIIGNTERFIMIDAGVSAKRLCNALSARGFDPDRAAAIFVTHEHSDHISGVRVFASKRKIPVYATAGTLCALDAGGHLAGVEHSVCPAHGVDIGGIFVKPFRTMHDTVESCGYVVCTPDSRRVAVITDTGCFTDTIRAAISGCDMVYIESNHDVDMLRKGPYPYELKQRILSPRGHLSNADCAAELAALAKTGSARFVLGHLSEENNRPRIAESASNSVLQALGLRRGIDYTLDIARPDGLPVCVF